MYIQNECNLFSAVVRKTRALCSCQVNIKQEMMNCWYWTTWLKTSAKMDVLDRIYNCSQLGYLLSSAGPSHQRTHSFPSFLFIYLFQLHTIDVIIYFEPATSFLRLHFTFISSYLARFIDIVMKYTMGYCLIQRGDRSSERLLFFFFCHNFVGRT